MAKKLMKKICLLGDGAVGKTSLIRKFVFDSFDDKYIMTFGTKVSKKEVSICRNGQEFNMTFLIWDILGQRVHDNVHSAYYQGAAGAFIVCDTTRLETLQHLEDWIKVFRTVNNDAPVVLLGNKFDLVSEMQFGDKELGEVAGRYNMKYHLTSAKTGDHVEDSFIELGNEVIDRHLNKGVKCNE
ncbi:MAG: GTP-binding protein [Candidatus Thermoplasmatota archaeon]|nr:GTP-binding protein [Euryarchaeota archaeon]MBU4031606.1 GTP-binding protein [Candidatus Thermoplasmatota archaeon]MBU4072391.1 GTP-binding protein [Candidatus Thermoplasmatota archaeon]MBU4144926.1 GTP-binding protein [Candidatus Thermoplasmatota archaeon]MBU4591681.1 GTP-binding protein [Candidatus Thermoplasmatota archaeon]